MNPSGSFPSYTSPGSAVIQLGVSRRSESHRSCRHEWPTSPRSSTTWSTPARVRWWLVARPPGPAPTTTTVTRTGVASGDGDVDRCRVGHDVKDRRTLLRLRHDRLYVCARRIGVDVIGDVDGVEAVAHVAVYAEDAEQIHVAFDRRRH